MSENVYLSVVLPCRNQADCIEEVLGRYKGPLDKIGRSYELVVVPNACTDDTLGITKRLAAADSTFRVIYNDVAGWGLSVLTGLAAARGQILCYTNSARTDPAHIAALLEQYEKSAPCLAKVRREKRAALMREMGSWLYNLEGSLIFGIKVGDINGTPKIMSREIYQKLQLTSHGDVLDMEVLAKITHLGLPIVEYPVAGFSRFGGKSSTNLKSAWNMYIGAVMLRDNIKTFKRKAP